MNGLSLRGIALALGGEVRRNQVCAPAPGHSKHDRSLVVKLADDKLGGFVVHSFAGEDPLRLKHYVRQRLGLPGWEPRSNGGGQKAFGAGSRTVAEYVYKDEQGDPSRKVVRTTDKAFPQ